MIVIKLDDLLWQNKMTSKMLAEKTGLGTATISKLRNGKNQNISLNTINILCKFFNCSVNDIIEYVKD